MVLWFEPNAEISSLAIQHNGLKKYIASKRLLHIDKIPADEELQKLFEGCINSEVLFCIHRASYTISTAYPDFQKTIENFLNRKSVNALTLARFDRLWMRNILRNFKILLQARPVKQLFESASGKWLLFAGQDLVFSMTWTASELCVKN